MKNFIIRTLALITILASTLSANANDWANFKRFDDANKALTKPPAVVFMGDSITDAWPNQSKKFFEENNYIGRGISGQVTSQMLVRLRRDVLDLKPKAVIILAGTNDIARNQGEISIENIFGNIASMAEIAKAHKLKVAIASVLPVYEYSWRKEIENPSEQIKDLNKLLKDYAKANGFAYVDYYSKMVDERGGLPKKLSGDGVHPNREGYEIMEQVAKESLSKLLK